MKAYEELLRTFVPDHEVAVTRGPGDEARLVDRAAEEGFGTVVAVGGDGTLSHVADRILESGADLRLGLLPSGTGNDFARNVGLRFEGMEAAVRALASGATRRVDVGRVVTPSRPLDEEGSCAEAHAPGRRPAPEPRPRHFLNVVGFGFDVAVILEAARARFLEGELLYKVTALRQLFGFDGFSVAVERGGAPTPEGRRLMVTVSNGRYFGGGFPIAPAGRVDDGRLHLCEIPDARPFRRAVLFARAERGRHTESEGVGTESAERFTLTFDEAPLFEVDGDVYVSSSARVEVEVLPAALDVAVGQVATR